MLDNVETQNDFDPIGGCHNSHVRCYAEFRPEMDLTSYILSQILILGWNDIAFLLFFISIAEEYSIDFGVVHYFGTTFYHPIYDGNV